MQLFDRQPAVAGHFVLYGR